MKDLKYYDRGFLNQDKGMASYEANVEANSYGVDASLLLSDCYRQITLDFSYYSDKQYSERLEKVDLLLQKIREMKDEMIESYDLYKAEEKVAEEKHALLKEEENEKAN